MFGLHENEPADGNITISWMVSQEDSFSHSGKTGITRKWPIPKAAKVKKTALVKTTRRCQRFKKFRSNEAWW